MNSGGKYYQLSGEIDIPRLLLAFLLILPLWGLAMLYAGALHWNPFTILAPVLTFFYAIGVGALIKLGIQLARIQQRFMNYVWTLIVIIGAVYFSWANFLAVWTHLPPTILLYPEVLWEQLVLYYQKGEFSTFTIEIRGIFGAIMWVLEIIVIAIVAYVLSEVSLLDEVFCVHCKKWVDTMDKFYVFRHPNEESLVTSFKRADMQFLDQAEKIERPKAKPKKDSVQYEIHASCCNTCSRSYYLSLEKIEADKDGDSINTMLVNLRHVSANTFKKLYAKSEHWFHYTESGKYSNWAWLSIPLSLAILAFLYVIYQSVIHPLDNPFFGLIGLVGIAFATFFMVSEFLKLFQVRNSSIAHFMAMMIGSFSIYLLHWAAFPFNGFVPIYEVWANLMYLLENGEWEWMEWTGLLFETIVVYVMPLIAATYVSSDRVYCEKCSAWATEEDDQLVFNYPKEEELKKKFREQDLSFFEGITAITPDAKDDNYFRINAEWCKNCDTVHTLSLEKVTRSYREGRYSFSFDHIYEDLIYTHDNFHEFMEKAAAWTKEVRKADGVEEDKEVQDS